MSLTDIIRDWDNTFGTLNKSRAEAPYYEDLARSNRDYEMAKAAMLSAEAQNAPQFYRGRAREQESQAGLKGLELQFAPEMSRAELELKRLQPNFTRAQIANMNEQLLKSRFSRENPLLDKAGTAGQIGALLYAQQHPELSGALGEVQELPGNVGALNEQMSPWKREDLEISPEGIGRLQNMFGTKGVPTKRNAIADLMKESLVGELKRKNAYAELANKKTENYGYGQLTADQKRAWIANAKGMGVGENEARDFFNKGYNIQDLAEAKGYDRNNIPEAVYNPTQTDITRAHFRQQAVAEIDAIQPVLTEALAPYSQRVAGFSPKQIAESLSGENPEGQARFFAAKALMPELSALRLKAMGGQVGIEAIREVQEASMASLSAFQGLVTPEVYMQAQQYMQEWINEASKTANSIAFNPERAQNKEIGSKTTKSAPEDPLGIR